MQRQSESDHITIHLIECRKKLNDEAEHRKSGNDSRELQGGSPSCVSLRRARRSSSNPDQPDEQYQQHQRDRCELEHVLVAIAVKVICKSPQAVQEKAAEASDETPDCGESEGGRRRSVTPSCFQQYCTDRENDHRDGKVAQPSPANAHVFR